MLVIPSIESINTVFCDIVRNEWHRVEGADALLLEAGRAVFEGSRPRFYLLALYALGLVVESEPYRTDWFPYFDPVAPMRMEAVSPFYFGCDLEFSVGLAEVGLTSCEHDVIDTRTHRALRNLSKLRAPKWPTFGRLHCIAREAIEAYGGKPVPWIFEVRHSGPQRAEAIVSRISLLALAIRSIEIAEGILDSASIDEQVELRVR